MNTKPLSIAAAVLAALAMSACGEKPAEPKAAAPAAAAQEKPAAAAPQEKQAAVASTIEINGNRATIKDGIDAAGEAKLKAASGITQINLREISDADLAKSIAMFPGVTHVQIFSNKVTDLAPLAKLDKLARLEISAEAASDFAPLAALSNLTDLKLHFAKLTDLAPLGKLTSLQRLELRASELADFSPLAACGNLKSLTYYAVKGADFSTLGKLTQLEELSGGDTKLDNIAWLPNLTNLKKLNIFTEDVTDYSPLAKTNIEELRIWDMNAPVDLGPVGKMPALKKLTLEGLNNASGSKALAGLSKLEELSIVDGYNKDGGEQFDFSGQGWTALKKLKIRDVPLQPAQIEAMKKMPALEYLGVNEKSCAEDALSGFGPNVRISR